MQAESETVLAPGTGSARTPNGTQHQQAAGPAAGAGGSMHGGVPPLQHACCQLATPALRAPSPPLTSWVRAAAPLACEPCCVALAAMKVQLDLCCPSERNARGRGYSGQVREPHDLRRRRDAGWVWGGWCGCKHQAASACEKRVGFPSPLAFSRQCFAPCHCGACREMAVRTLSSCHQPHIA